MKKLIQNSIGFLMIATCSVLLITFMNSCNKDDDNNNVTQTFVSKVNLVASTSAYPGATVDPNLVNGWGIAFSPTGNAWISAADAGVSVIYDKSGTQLLAPVSIPSPTAATGGGPTGQVYNGTGDFKLTDGNPAKFIFAGEDGVISGWNAASAGAAEKKVDRSATSVYLGLTIAANGANNYLYAADFKSRKIDVFDKDFALVPMPFTDPDLPAGYSPFNIQSIGTSLFVMYAKVDEVTGEEEKGAGFGYVDIYNTDGSLVKRFASGGELNAPWGVAAAPSGFMDGVSIIVGNFGDGRFIAYDATGNSKGPLKSSDGNTIVVDGLWGISFAPATATTVDPTWLFFAAGPNDETEGLFGYLKK